MDPRTELLSLAKTLSPISLREDAQELKQKINRIASVLQENGELKKDRGIAATLLDASASLEQESIQRLREELLYDAFTELDAGMLKLYESSSLGVQDRIGLQRDSLFRCGVYDSETSVLTIHPDVLKRQEKEQFWKFIERNEVRSLEIKTKDPLFYSLAVLQLLTMKKPPLSYLTDTYELQFTDGKLIVPKAKLLLCGSYFEDLLTDTGNMGEKEISFKDTPISLSLFQGVLYQLETGLSPEEEYQVARKFLQFAEFPAPPGAFGPQEWEYYFAEVTENIPPVPRGLLEQLQKPCPFQKGKLVSETHSLIFIPKDLSLFKLHNLCKNLENIDPLDLDIRGAAHEICMKEVKQSHWALISRELINLGIIEQHDQIFDSVKSFPGYEVPSLIHVVTACLADYLRKGEVLLTATNPYAPVCCVKEMQTDWWDVQTVGPFDPAKHSLLLRGIRFLNSKRFSDKQKFSMEMVMRMGGAGVFPLFKA